MPMNDPQFRRAQLRKAGTGTLTLSQANTYTGGTTMDAASGTLALTSNATAAGTGAIVPLAASIVVPPV